MKGLDAPGRGGARWDRCRESESDSMIGTLRL